MVTLRPGRRTFVSILHSFGISRSSGIETGEDGVFLDNRDKSIVEVISSTSVGVNVSIARGCEDEKWLIHRFPPAVSEALLLELRVVPPHVLPELENP